MPKIANPTKRQMRAILDRKWSAFVRSHGRCESDSSVSPCGGRLTNSHIIGRNNIKVQFDPRNTQCICGSEHASFTLNPLIHTDYVRRSSCHQYEETVLLQSRDSMIKPDYEVWFKIYDIVTQKNMSLEQAREWLGQTVVHTVHDIPEIS